MLWKARLSLRADWPQHQEAAPGGVGVGGKGLRPWGEQRVGYTRMMGSTLRHVLGG